MGHQPSTTNQVGMVGLEPTTPCARNTWVCRYPTSRKESERRELNPRPPGPQPARCQASPRSDPSPDHPSAVRESNPSPTGIRSPSASIHGTGHTCALVPKWAGRCSNPRLRLFRPPLNRLSYQPNKKSPTSLLTPGLLPSTGIGAECHKRKGYRGCKLALDAQLPVDMRFGSNSATRTSLLLFLPPVLCCDQRVAID